MVKILLIFAKLESNFGKRRHENTIYNNFSSET